jgi:hypothetical protein
MAIEQEGRIGRPQSVLHDNYSNILDIKIDILAVVEGICRRDARRGGCRRERENLIVPMLIQSLGIGK